MKKKLTKDEIYTGFPCLYDRIEELLKEHGKTVKDVEFVTNLQDNAYNGKFWMEGREFMRLAKDIHFEDSYENGYAFNDLQIAIKGGGQIIRTPSDDGDRADWFRYIPKPEKTGGAMTLNVIIHTDEANIWYKTTKISSNGADEDEDE